MLPRPRLVVLLVGLVSVHVALGDFRGTVLAPDGKPAADVELRLVRILSDDLEVVDSARSGEDGTYRFKKLDLAVATGISVGDLQVLARDSAGRFGASESLRLHRYQGDVPTFSLVESTDLSGRVRHIDGTPVEGLTVHAQGAYHVSRGAERDTYVRLMPEFREPMSARSDAAGRFLLKGIPKGTKVALRLEGSGYGVQETNCEFGGDANIRIERTRKVEGRMSGKGVEASALAGSKLRIWSTEWSARREGDYLARQRSTGVTISDDGRFVAELTSGKFVARLDESDAAATPLHGANLDVSAEATPSAITIPVEPLMPVTGRVIASDTNKGVADARVEIMYIDERGTIVERRPATTDAEGRYGGSVRKGRVLVSVIRLPEAYYLPRRAQNHKPESDKPVEYPDLVVDPAGRIDGIVVDEAGEPAPDAEVTAPIAGDGLFERRGWPQFGANRLGPDCRFTLLQIDPNDSVTVFVRTPTAASNLTTTVVPCEQKEPLRIVVSEKNTVRIRGVVEDENGPAAGQAVSIWSAHHFRTTGKGIMLGMGSAVAYATTDEHGEFVTPALWADMPYRVSLRTGQGPPVERKIEAGKPGEILDAGKFTIERNVRNVTGLVRDASGKPVADANVYAVGAYTPQPRQRSDAEGRFHLERVQPGYNWVFAEKDGYRLAGEPIADSSSVLLTLRDRDAPPKRSPASRPSRAAREAAARRIVDAIERVREMHADRSYGSVIARVARFDAERAEQMAAASGMKASASIITELVRRAAPEDAQEAVALAKQLSPGPGGRLLRICAERLLRTDREKSLRYAEEALAIARGLDEAERSATLAILGDLLIRLGREEAGQGLISEAAAAAERFGATDSYCRRAVAWALAARDPNAAMKLIEAIREDSESRYASGVVIARTALTDPEFAIARLRELSEPFQRDQLAARVAAAIAQKESKRAIAVAEAIAIGTYRARALTRVAAIVAERDRQTAFKLIEQAMAALMDKPSDLYSYSNLGGGALFGVEVALAADEIGYPHVDELLLRTLSMVELPGMPRDALVNDAKRAGAIGMIDPALGRRLLADMRPSFEKNPMRSDWLVQRAWLSAWATVDPDEAANIACELLETYRPDASEHGLGGNGVLDALGVLTLRDDERLTWQNPLLMNTMLGGNEEEP